MVSENQYLGVSAVARGLRTQPQRLGPLLKPGLDSLAPHSGLKDPALPKLGPRSDSDPDLGTSLCCGCGHETAKKEKKKKWGFRRPDPHKIKASRGLPQVSLFCPRHLRQPASLHLPLEPSPQQPSPVTATLVSASGLFHTRTAARIL